MKVRQISILITTIFTIVFSVFVYASTLQNTSGYAWSDNIGWISFNSTDDQDSYTTGIQSSSVDFGVNFDENTGTGSGYAWSDNIGWISFNDAEVSSNNDCPDKTSNCGPRINWLSDGGGEMTGFARACSVFKTGCSGKLNPDYFNGGWDGFISLGDDNPAWGIRVGADGIVVGYAWGNEVVGWTNFNKVFLTLIPKSCIPPQIPNPINGNKCEIPPDCTAEEVFDVNTWQCIGIIPPPDEGCPPGQIWNGIACVKDPTDGGDGGDGGGGDGGGGTGENKCSEPLVPDSSGNCVPCSSGKVYDSKTKTCVDKKKPGFEEF